MQGASQSDSPALHDRKRMQCLTHFLGHAAARQACGVGQGLGWTEPRTLAAWVTCMLGAAPWPRGSGATAKCCTVRLNWVRWVGHLQQMAASPSVLPC